MKALLVGCSLCLASIAAGQESAPAPVVTGYVTRVTSASDFDVDGWRIVCGPQTSTTMLPQHPSRQHVYRPGCPQNAPRIGLPVAVWGARDKQQPTIAATQLDLGPVRFERISSYGIIETVVSRSPRSLVVQADGYTIRIPASAHIEFKKPLHSWADVATNVWLDYKGEQQADGTVLAAEARFGPNWLNPKAEKVRKRTDYDPTKVTKPGSLGAKLVLGPDAMQIPTWPDAAMQARVAAVGAKLVPAYQRRLSDTDLTKIDFRFYVTTGDRWLRGIVALPSGIILVPHQIVDRMQNDSQLAAVLADSIAVEMESQDLRMLPGVRPTGKQMAGELALDTGAVMVPELGLALVGVGVTGATRTLNRELQQSARVSLTLMQAAGYDTDQAPIAWWRLAEKDGKSLAETPLPEQSVNLYHDLSTTWAASSPVPGNQTAAR